MSALAGQAGDVARVRSGTGVRALVILLAVAVVVVLATVKPAQDEAADGLLELSELGRMAPVFLIVAYCVAACLLLPALPLDLAAGAHFGFWEGVFWVQLAAAAASICAFQLSRHVFRGFVRRRLDKRPLFRAIDSAVEEDGWRLVFLTRLSPILSFSLLSWLYGVTNVSFPAYVAATFVGVLPGTALYVTAGMMARDLTGAPQTGQPALEWALEIGAFIVSAAVIVYVTRKAQRVLKEKLAVEQPATTA